MSNATLPDSPTERTFLGHPLGLYVLFLTEMWERFSYYGMRALLMLYMVKHYKWAQDSASIVSEFYTSLVYVTPLIGGFLADRYIGNRWAVIIGAILMSIGHFLMAFEPYAIFFSALVFLIIGNGFFKPNMTTQVGRLYPPNDPRLDGAYTIFYMGINLGAFLSPLVCGWLQQNISFHAGFAAAGVGMVLGLVTYIVGAPLVKEIKALAAKKAEGTLSPTDPDAPISDAQAELAPSVAPWLNKPAPLFFIFLGLALMIAAPVWYVLEPDHWDAAIIVAISSGASFFSAWIVSRTHQASRDRVLAIYLLGLFVIFFWAAFEQASTAMNLWADSVTNRYLTADPLAPNLVPGKEPKADAGFLTFLNPVPTAWFQSINALGIFLLAPLFAWLWVWLDERGYKLSSASKMAIGLLLQASAFGLMIFSARAENQPSQTPLTALPPGIERREDGTLIPKTEGEKKEHPYQQGRITFDPAGNLVMTGVLPDTERERIVRDTAPKEYKQLLHIVREVSQKAGAEKKTIELEIPASVKADPSTWFAGADAKYTAGAKDKPGKLTLTVQLSAESPIVVTIPDGFPTGFDLKQAAAVDNAKVDLDKKTLTVTGPLADRDELTLRFAAGDPTFRTAIDALFIKSATFRVSSWWLFWFYILSTLGELCLSPVGLSMVSKLSPEKYATMLMGLWLLTSFFGNFIAGFLSKYYDKFAPATYFAGPLIALTVGALALFVLVQLIKRMMHGVR